MNVRLFKITIGLLLALNLAQHHARAFSLLGPYETWQDDVHQYIQGTIGGPHVLGEEFRWNTPTITFGFDDSFLNYFGADGVKAVEQAFQILNDLPLVSEMSKELREFPLDTRRENFRATALSLYDLKSFALRVIIEEMGLASPETYTWTLRSHSHDGGPPPVLDFTVIQRNYDPVTLQPSSYVNDVLYTYDILHVSTPIHRADAFETPIDPFALSFSSVASEFFLQGVFFTGLTRDDVGGLRYLLKPQNVNVENLPINSTIQPVPLVNRSNLVTIPSIPLELFSDQALTNSTAQLLALYPDLAFTNITTSFTNIIASNVFFFFTNAPWAPAGSFPVLGTNVIFTTNVSPLFSYVFTNVFTNHFRPDCLVRIEQNDVVPAPYDPRFNPFLTNLTTRIVLTNNCLSGDVYIVPTNLFGYEIVSTQLITVTEVTNTVYDIIDPFSGLQKRLDLITFLTNYTYLGYPIEKFIPTNTSTVTRPGLDKLTFQRVDFDSLLGQFVTFTNIYTDQFITNSTAGSQVVERIVDQPDFHFYAADLGLFAPFPEVPVVYSRTIAAAPAWIDNALLNGIPGIASIGPGQIVGPINITFSTLAGSVEVGPILDPDPAGLFLQTAELQQTPFFFWGSFDGTTNAPIVYPVGTSIEALEKQVLGRDP